MKRRNALSLSVVLLAASACSGSDGEADEVPAAEAADVATIATTDAADATDIVTTEPADSTESVDTSGGSDAASPDASDEGFCDAILAIRTSEFAIEEAFGEEARGLFADVQSAAPPEVADDVEVIIDALDTLAEIGISADENDPDAVDRATDVLFDPAFAEANQNLDVYTTEACDGDLVSVDDEDPDGLDS